MYYLERGALDLFFDTIFKVIMIVCGVVLLAGIVKTISDGPRQERCIDGYMMYKYEGKARWESDKPPVRCLESGGD